MAAVHPGEPALLDSDIRFGMGSRLFAKGSRNMVGVRSCSDQSASSCDVGGLLAAPADVLVGMGLLTPEHLEDWRRGRVPYLERVINCNLSRLSRLLRILRLHAHELNLKPSWTAYMRWGKWPRQRLRFTKTGDPKLEEAYATHFVWPGEGPFPASAPKEDAR